MKKCAVIDIGTNSMRLLVAEIEDETIINREKHLIPTRMGQGVDSNGVISQQAMIRNIDALKQFKYIARQENVDRIIVFGTSALRDAKNGKDFVYKVKEKLDLDVDIISGSLEAQYAFLGVASEYPHNNLIIIDIGGGSTEFVSASNNRMINNKSINIGSVRLTEKYVVNDPPSVFELDNLKVYIDEMIRSIENPFINEEYMVIGIGGTATTISSINQSLDKYEPYKIHGSKVKMKEIESMLEDLISKDNIQRKGIKGLNPQRSDIIIAGVYIAQRVLKYYGKNEVIVSDYDNLEGALNYYMRN